MVAIKGSDRIDLGARGEAAVERWYRSRGAKVLARNWRCRNGELDLIVAMGNTIVFCEVKTRSSARFGVGFEAVGSAKQQRLRQLALVWLAGQRKQYRELRFDVASVDDGVVRVLEGAF